MSEPRHAPSDTIDAIDAEPAPSADAAPTPVAATPRDPQERPASSDPEAMDGDLGAYGADGVGGGVG